MVSVVLFIVDMFDVRVFEKTYGSISVLEKLVDITVGILCLAVVGFDGSAWLEGCSYSNVMNCVGQFQRRGGAADK